VRYRQVGEFDWHVGRTQNVSRSGVLVCAEQRVDVDVSVELRVELPPSASGKGNSAEIACHGRVVRTVPETDDCREPGYAVSIDSYDFVPSVTAVIMTLSRRGRANQRFGDSALATARKSSVNRSIS
jgi:hypothetical protein